MQIKLCGTEIWIGSVLFSKGLTGPAYAEALRKAEELEQEIKQALEVAYDQGEEEGYKSGSEDCDCPSKD